MVAYQLYKIPTPQIWICHWKVALFKTVWCNFPGKVAGTEVSECEVVWILWSVCFVEVSAIAVHLESIPECAMLMAWCWFWSKLAQALVMVTLLDRALHVCVYVCVLACIYILCVFVSSFPACLAIDAVCIHCAASQQCLLLVPPCPSTSCLSLCVCTPCPDMYLS